MDLEVVCFVYFTTWLWKYFSSLRFLTAWSLKAFLLTTWQLTIYCPFLNHVVVTLVSLSAQWRHLSRYPTNMSISFLQRPPNPFISPAVGLRLLTAKDGVCAQGEVALKQVFLRVRRFSPVAVTLPLHCIHSCIMYGQCDGSCRNSIETQSHPVVAALNKPVPQIFHL